MGYCNQGSFFLKIRMNFYDQGCHYLLDAKFKDFSRIFQDLFKQIQDLLYQNLNALHLFFLESVRQYTYCINKLYYSAFQFDFSSNYG